MPVSADLAKVALIHFSPLEMYPPAMNLIRALAADGWAVGVDTTWNRHGGKEFQISGAEIVRHPNPAAVGGWRRAWCYVQFQVGTLVSLVRARPAAILYIEPSSSFPVYLYSLLRPGVPILIHHHEYHSEDQFWRPGMRLIRWFHLLEKRRLLGRARWVSHTNAKRLELFAVDCPMVAAGALRVLPNYPPASWREGRNEAWAVDGGPFRFVYAGSLSLRDTFLAAFVDWLLAQPKGSVQFDIYAYNLDAETRDYLAGCGGEVVRFFAGGVDYEALPGVLRGYHAGVILYRAETLNYRFNETNKLFEYLACGLDVWYSHRMEGVRPHAREDRRPRVVECDFARLGRRDVSRLMERSVGEVGEVCEVCEVGVFDVASACAPLLGLLRGWLGRGKDDEECTFFHQ